MPPQKGYTGAELIEGDVRNEATLGSPLDGGDSVVSALGASIGFRKEPVDETTALR